MKPFVSKLPATPVSIFSRMSQLAQTHQAVNLSQGFPDFDLAPELIQLVTTYMQKGFNQYAPMPGTFPLRECIAKKYQVLAQTIVDPETEITITAGGTQALFTAIGTLISPGDEAIIFEPAYDSYRPSIEAFGGKVIPFSLQAPAFRIDWEEVEHKITERTRVIIINNPNNPTGRILTRADIIALEHLVVTHGLFVISDEVYEHITYDGQSHESVLQSPILRERAYVVASFGKLLHATGWKIGYVVANTHLTAEFRKIHQFNVFSVNTPMQMAIAEYLSDINYYSSLPLYFQEKRDYLAKALAQTRFKVLPCEGTYFMLLDYSSISDLSELDFAVHLTQTAGVAMIPVSSFYTDNLNQSLLRICFAKKEETLDEAIDHLLKI
ncbi:aminotransferase class I/II-fold pyridoxal phosphate-dependent enzyme [Parapedobacter sp. SGR-10]|uniref:methionine aminotransferase n=1 Tax=Parapedobacter sp. SGR-10 TaxID=2710879 RepID=UPI0013D817D3|nr:methionine aminotransferase [Parapedobacter sp. SGR-10]NGF55908.1 aminotransferase class I/II-fold pyridoxal phosphate-dependent enzyme [Parapedobacter sp. SGR-10]